MEEDIQKAQDVQNKTAIGSIADSIESRIFTIRGKQVMIDRDLAELYGVETKHLNRQVARNITRFPEDFMFQLTDEEFSILKCQIEVNPFICTFYLLLPNVRYNF